MKLTARIKRKTFPVAKGVRLTVPESEIIFINNMGDSALLYQLMAAGRKAGRLDDYFLVDVTNSRKGKSRKGN